MKKSEILFNDYYLHWLQYLLIDFGVHHPCSVHLYCDNNTTLHIVINLIFHEQNKYIEIDCHLIYEKIQNETILIQFV